MNVPFIVMLQSGNMQTNTFCTVRWKCSWKWPYYSTCRYFSYPLHVYKIVAIQLENFTLHRTSEKHWHVFALSPLHYWLPLCWVVSITTTSFVCIGGVYYWCIILYWDWLVDNFNQSKALCKISIETRYTQMIFFVMFLSLWNLLAKFNCFTILWLPSISLSSTRPICAVPSWRRKDNRILINDAKNLVASWRPFWPDLTYPLHSTTYLHCFCSEQSSIFHRVVAVVVYVVINKA